MCPLWRFEQSTGRLYRGDELIATGYAGRGAGKNNPDLQHLPDGPIPRGRYIISWPRDDARMGRVSIKLGADPKNKMFKRADCFVHGDNPATLGDSSWDGSIVVPPRVRFMLRADWHEWLIVEAGNG